MTPEQLAKPDTEAAHQIAFFCWAALNVAAYPELKWMHHIPNGDSRGDTKKSRQIRGGKLKAMGVKEGVVDVFLPVRRGCWSGLYIEFKKPSEKAKTSRGKGGVKPKQQEFMDFVKEQGFGAMVVYHWEEAAEAVEQYLNWS